MERKAYDLVVVGAGPGGYVAAIRAAQLGMSAACVDEHERLGGTCLRVGCIPTKALLESSARWEEVSGKRLAEHGIKVGGAELDLHALHKRKNGIVAGLTSGIAALFKKNRIDRFQGRGRLAGAGLLRVEGRDTLELQAKHVLLAPGSHSASLPGVALDGDRIGTSTEALSYPEVPRRLVVVGAGFIGLELGTVWRRLGSQVTVVEYLDRILPGTDLEIAREAQKLLRRQGLEFRLGCRVRGAGVEHGECVVEIEGQEPARGDRVLVAVGRKPATADLGLETINVTLDEKGRIPIADGYATSAAGVFAIGDAVRGPQLAHKASEEGVACVERLAGLPGRVDKDVIPGVCYTEPEIASVGRTEEALVEAGVEFGKGVFHFRATPRARCLGALDGRVKILADAKTGRLLGVHMLGPHVGELIAEAAAAMALHATAEDLGRLCHAHPTLAEAVKEAALDVARRAIHA
ncbi:MAG: dihydrolipoyl dehydrogenase [Deltaproteobacteria bacterium]|nr:dihydrolipoyl dehydrogenase [Deltaproteobacteria bacterium]